MGRGRWAGNAGRAASGEAKHVVPDACGRWRCSEDPQQAGARQPGGVVGRAAAGFAAGWRREGGAVESTVCGCTVRHGAAPSLPEAYIKAIDGAAIGPRAGSCGTAAYRAERVIVTDITQDPLWADYPAEE